MRILLRTKRMLMPMVMASMFVFVGCTDNDYDFNDVDVTLGLGSDELLIPTSSTKTIALNDILKLNDGDCVKMLDNGDYVFIQDGGTVAPVHPNINKVILVNKVLHKEEMVLDDAFGNVVRHKAGRRMRAAEDVTYSIEESEDVQVFEYTATQPEILSLTSTDVDGSIGMVVGFSDNLERCVASFDEMRLFLPGYMKIRDIQCSMDYSLDGNILSFKNVPTNKDLTFRANVYKFDFTDYNKEQGELSPIVNGKLQLTGSVKMAVKANGTIGQDKIQYMTDCRVTSEMTLNDIEINGAEGKFDPKIDLTDLGDVEVSGTPDFLKDDDVYIDLANPQILVGISSDMNVTANINAVLSSVKDGKVMKSVNVDNIKLHPASGQVAVTNICICRDKTKVEQAYKDYDIYEVPDLSELISTIPDKISFTAATAVDNTHDSHFLLGHDYTIEPSYSVVAPIAFGPKAVIVYTDSIDNIRDDIEDLDLADNARIEITADVVNRMPVNMKVDVVPMDADGNSLAGTVGVAVEDNIPAAADGESANGTMKIVLTQKQKAAVKLLDKLRFRISGAASGDDAQAITGVTLNSKKHSLQLENVKAKLVGRLIYDAN